MVHLPSLPLSVYTEARFEPVRALGTLGHNFPDHPPPTPSTPRPQPCVRGACSAWAPRCALCLMLSPCPFLSVSALPGCHCPLSCSVWDCHWVPLPVPPSACCAQVLWSCIWVRREAPVLGSHLAPALLSLWEQPALAAAGHCFSVL